jgi:dTDP-4-dehydrorhamnose reductase
MVADSVNGSLVVTGADGQLGRAFARVAPGARLLSRKDLDVRDAEAAARIIERIRPATIVHAAAWTKVDLAEAEPDIARAINVDGTSAIAQAANGVGALLVYPSTDYVFAGRGHRPYREDDPTGPLSVYGATKLRGEEAARTADEHLIVRTSWVFGDGNNFILAILRGGRERDTLDVVDDQIGCPTYAVDLARAILELTGRDARGLFHLAGEGACSWADLADASVDAAFEAGLLTRGPRVRRVSTSEYEATRRGPVAPRPRYSVLDCSKAANLGVRLRPWLEAVREYVQILAREGSW